MEIKIKCKNCGKTFIEFADDYDCVSGVVYCSEGCFEDAESDPVVLDTEETGVMTAADLWGY